MVEGTVPSGEGCLDVPERSRKLVDLQKLAFGNAFKVLQRKYSSPWPCKQVVSSIARKR